MHNSKIGYDSIDPTLGISVVGVVNKLSHLFNLITVSRSVKFDSVGVTEFQQISGSYNVPTGYTPLGIIGWASGGYGWSLNYANLSSTPGYYNIVIQGLTEPGTFDVKLYILLIISEFYEV